MPLKKITYYISLAALFLIPLFVLFPIPHTPFGISNNLFFPFITGKAFYFRMLVEIAFASWLILAFIDPKYRPKISSLSVGVTVFTIIALAADLLGVNPIRSLWSNFERMEGWMVIIHLWAFYMVVSSVFSAEDNGTNSSQSKKLWHRWFNTSVVVAIIVAFYALFQQFGWTAIHQGSSRLDASLGNSAYLAVYMLFHIFIAAYLFFARGSVGKVAASSFTRFLLGLASLVILALFVETSHLGVVAILINVVLLAAVIIAYWRMPSLRPSGMESIYAVLIVFFSIILLETQTRGTILGLIGGVMLTLALYAIFGKGEQNSGRILSGSVIGLIIILAIVFWLNRTNPIIVKNPVLGRFTNISWSDASNQARQYIWPMAINGALKRPVLGWGQENFNYIFNADYNPKMWSQEQWFDRAHNVFLDWLVAGGIVGLIAYLAMYVLFAIAIWRSSLTVKEKSILTGLLAAYAIHNVFVFDNLASYIMFFAILGFARSLQSSQPVTWFSQAPLRQDAVEYIVSPIVIVALVAVFYVFNIRPITANTRLISALTSCEGPNPDPGLFLSALSVNTYVANQEIHEQVFNCAGGVIGMQNVPGPTKQAFVSLADQSLSDQIKATPNDARIYTLGGAYLVRIGQYAKANPILETAHKLSPEKQSIDLELATAYLNTGKTDEALALLKHSYESATDYPQAKSAYAVALVLSGKEADARKLFGDDPSIFVTEQMAQVYVDLKQFTKAVAVYEDLLKNDPKNVNYAGRLAQIEYIAGMSSQAIATLQALEKDHPELKDQIEAAIAQVRSGK